MLFLQLIKNHVNLCHPDQITLHELKLCCNLCQTIIIQDVYKFIDTEKLDEQSPKDNFLSSRLAQALYEWTGNDQIPMSFTLVDVEGIHPERIRGQSLRRIYECIRLLRAINAPFTTDKSTGIPSEEMTLFFKNYLDAVSKFQSTSMSNAEKMLDQFIKSMYQYVQSDDFTNPFGFYFEKLVPYVQSCVPHWTPVQATSEASNLAVELHVQLQISSAIRKEFGKYSIPFDIIHVMVGCYLCSCDTSVVSNWILDMMARICKGHYFWKQYSSCLFVERMQHLLTTEITYKKRTDLYYVIRDIRQGKASESFSAFWTNYLRLQTLVNEKYNIPQIPHDILQIAISQTFPAVLFENNNDLIGFTLALSHLIMSSNIKTGEIKKGTFKKSRKIHEIIVKLVDSVIDYDKERTLPWNLSTLELYFVKNQGIENQIQEIMQLLLMKEDDE